MRITIGDKIFENNPTATNQNLVFMGTVHTGTGIQENIYGFNEQQIIEVAMELKKLNKDFNIVHIWGPCNHNSERNYIGYRML